MNHSGKTMTIFLVVFAVLLMCLTGIAVFHLLKERDLRLGLEANLEQVQTNESKLQGDLKEAQKKIFILESESKEAVERMEGLIEEVALEKGLKEELRKESRQLKETLSTEKQARETLQQQLSDLEDRLTSLQAEYDQVRAQNEEIQSGRAALQKEYEQLQRQLEEAQAQVQAAAEAAQEPSADQGVNLDPIVVNPANDQGSGQVVSVDKDADFLIVSLGKKHGIKKGQILTVNRNGQAIGEVQVSRVLPEMSAADFLAPLTSANVQVNDQVIVKK